MSRFAKLNIEIETPHTPRYVEGLADVVHSVGNQAASISSGSFQDRRDGGRPLFDEDLVGNRQLLRRQPDRRERRTWC